MGNSIWMASAIAGAVVTGIAGALVVYWRSGRAWRLATRFGAEHLAAVRILACGSLLGNALWEDLSSTARLPPELVQPMGVDWLVRQVPGIDGFYTSPDALMAFQLVAVVLLALATVGWCTRITLPAATLAALVLGGILREYSHLFHTCLVPLWIAGALCFTPCADAWSADAVRRAFAGCTTPRRDGAAYGWGVIAAWTMLAGAYFCAGVSKLRAGGFGWWDSINIQRIFLQESLNPMEFDWSISLALADAPASVFGALGLAAMGLEFVYPCVLFSRAARRCLPLAAVGFHTGTLLLQNILFFDLMILQLVFLDYGALNRRWHGWRARRGMAIDVRYDGARAATRASAEVAATSRPQRLAIGALGLWVLGALGVELYPLTSWQMFSGSDRTGIVEYYQVRQVAPDGTVRPGEIDRCFASLRDGRYRRVLPMAFDARRDTLRRFLDACADELERRGQPVREFVIEKWRWHFRSDPGDSRRGVIVARYSHVP